MPACTPRRLLEEKGRSRLQEKEEKTDMMRVSSKNVARTPSIPAPVFVVLTFSHTRRPSSEQLPIVESSLPSGRNRNRSRFRCENSRAQEEAPEDYSCEGRRGRGFCSCEERFHLHPHFTSLSFHVATLHFSENFSEFLTQTRETMI